MIPRAGYQNPLPALHLPMPAFLGSDFGYYDRAPSDSLIPSKLRRFSFSRQQSIDVLTTRRCQVKCPGLCNRLCRRNGLQSVAVWPKLPLPQQEGKQYPQKSQDGENPHTQAISCRIVRAGMAVVVGPANEQVKAEQADVLDHSHQPVGCAQFG